MSHALLSDPVSGWQYPTQPRVLGPIRAAKPRYQDPELHDLALMLVRARAVGDEDQAEEIAAQRFARLRYAFALEHRPRALLGGLVLDWATRQAYVGLRPVFGGWDRQGCRFLFEVAEGNGQVVRYRDLFEKVWGIDAPTDAYDRQNMTMLRMQLARVRRRIRQAGGDGRCIVAAWSDGLKVVVENEWSEPTQVCQACGSVLSEARP